MRTTIDPRTWSDPNQWAVYSHALPAAPDTPLWVGYCRAHDVLACPDARVSPAWREALGAQPALVVTVHSLHNSGHHAMRAVLRLMRAARPLVNGTVPDAPIGNCRPVRCIETGEVFESCAALARRTGIHASQLSVYLQRRDGRALRGLHYEYC